MALSHFIGKISSKTLGTSINIPLILTLSVIPDVDLFLKSMLRHGGPTHSLIMFIVLFLPAILIWRKTSIPYFAATASHSLVGDYLTRSFNHRHA